MTQIVLDVGPTLFTHHLFTGRREQQEKKINVNKTTENFGLHVAVTFRIHGPREINFQSDLFLFFICFSFRPIRLRYWARCKLFRVYVDKNE